MEWSSWLTYTNSPELVDLLCGRCRTLSDHGNREELVESCTAVEVASEIDNATKQISVLEFLHTL